MLVAAFALFAGTNPAIAQPPPPPSNPSDQDLARSQSEVAAKAGEIGRLTGELFRLEQQADDLQAALGGQREEANKALVDVQTAQGAAAAAQLKVEAARGETEAATVSIEAARTRLDEFAAMAYQQGLDSGPLALLVGSTTPDELVDRAQFAEVIGQQQLAALDGLERARVAMANADSAARAARDEAQAKAEAAERAKDVADAAVRTAQQAADAQATELAKVDARRAEVQRLLAEAESRNTGLRDQRKRYQEWQAKLAAEQAAKERAEKRAAEGRLGGRGGGPPVSATGTVRTVLDRALSQLGVPYVWGGGDANGRTRGVRGGAADYRRDFSLSGFDCSGLTLYAYAGVGIRLGHYTGYQYQAGRKVPVGQRQPGDLLFYRNSREIHHMSMYLGNGQMIEAPYTGANVRIVPVRTRELMSNAVRLIG